MRKEYTDNLFFDNIEEAETEQLSAFSLEACIRQAARADDTGGVGGGALRSFCGGRNMPKLLRKSFAGIAGGHHLERTVSTTVGGLKVKVPRVSDNREAFESRLVKPYKRRSEGLDCLFPNLFVEGLATRDA